jgi:hypothetical protein
VKKRITMPDPTPKKDLPISEAVTKLLELATEYELKAHLLRECAKGLADG